MKPFYDVTMMDTLEKLGNKTGKDILGLILDLYRGKSPEILQSIEEHLESEDFGEVGELTHKLKSSCANLGFFQLQEKLNSMESICRGNPDKKQLEKDLIDVKEMYLRSLEVLESRVASKTA